MNSTCHKSKHSEGDVKHLTSQHTFCLSLHKQLALKFAGGVALIINKEIQNTKTTKTQHEASWFAATT